MSNAIFPVGSEASVPDIPSQSGKIKTRNKKPFKKRIWEFIDSGPIQIFMGIILLVSLFLPDSWILANAHQNHDDILFSILTAILVLFCCETTILSYCQDDYFLGFFFWMDTIGTVSIILDIGWIADTFMPSSGITTKGSLLRAARAAKLGARYGRIMRLMKMMRFLKFLPCFKQDESGEPEPTMSAVRKVSAELSAVLSRRVAALVMLLVIVVPFLSYDVTDYGSQAWCVNYKLAAIDNTTTLTDIETMVHKMKRFYHTKEQTPMKLVVESPFFQTYHEYYNLGYYIRPDNVVLNEEQYHIDSSKYHVKLFMNNTVINQWNSFYGIMLIILVVVVLVGFSASFQSAVDILIVVPLEKMMNTLRKSATAMLKSMKAMSKEDEETNRKIQESGENSDDLDGELETAVLEKIYNDD